MKAVVYQFSDYATEQSHAALVPLSTLDQLPLEQRLKEILKHCEALDARIAVEYKNNRRQLRRLRKAQARFKKTVRNHQKRQPMP